MPLQLIATLLPKDKVIANIAINSKVAISVHSFNKLSSRVITEQLVATITQEFIQRISILPDATLHTHSVDSPNIILFYTFLPANTLHSHSADSSLIYVRPEVIPEDTLHNHNVDSPSLAVKYNLIPEDASHSHSADSPDLIIPAYSPEVQAVLDRMTALTQTEIDAIETFVDGCVADGTWTDIVELFCFALNGTDMLTGWVSNTATVGSGSITDAAAQGLTFDTTTSYLDAGFGPTLLANDTCSGFYLTDHAGSGTGNSDIFGSVDSGFEYYVRHRGSDTLDYNVVVNTTGTIARTNVGDATPLANELFQLWFNGTTTGGYDRGTASQSGAGTFENKSTVNFFINGRNSSGLQQNGKVHTTAIQFFANNGATFDRTSFRLRVLQLLRDLGTTGVPAA